MTPLLSILRDVHDARDFNARYELASVLFLALAATLCGSKSCVEIADFAAANEEELAGIVDLPHGTPSHDCFSRVFRLLDPAELSQTFARFAAALRQALGVPPASGVVAFEACDADGTTVSFEQRETGHDRTEWRRASVVPLSAGCPAFPGLVALGRIMCERQRTGATGTRAAHYVALSFPTPPRELLSVMRSHWGVENQVHWPLDVVFREDEARTRKDNAPANLSLIRRIALEMLRTHLEKKSIARKMNLARWRLDFFYELSTHMR